MSLVDHLRVAGIGLILLAGVHLVFPKRFRWREDLAKLSLLNRQIFLVHTFFICLVLLLMGSLCAFATDALVERTRLAWLVLGGLAVFWGIRLLFQWLVYDARLWRGDRFPTTMHLLFTCIWTYSTAVFAYGWWTLLEPR